MNRSRHDDPKSDPCTERSGETEWTLRKPYDLVRVRDDAQETHRRTYPATFLLEQGAHAQAHIVDLRDAAYTAYH